MKTIHVFLPLLILACNSKPNSSTNQQNSLATKTDTSRDSIVFTELFNPSQIPTQSFSVDAQKAFSVKGKMGTVILGKANCFVDANNQAVTGKIELTLQEAYHIADFVNGNLTTLHNGKPLESGGMLNILASQNGKALQLKSGSELQVSAPNFKKQKNMSLFEGVVADNSINWINPVPIVPSADNTADIELIESADWKMDENLETTIAPKNISEEEIIAQGMAEPVMDVAISEKDMIAQGMGEAWPEPVLNKETLQPKVSIRFNQFRVDPNIVSFNFTVKKLGWANIDRLYSDPRSKPVNITTSIASDSFRLVYITMAIPDLNIFIPGYKKGDNTYGFSHNDAEQQVLPIGQKVFIIATSYQSNQYYSCIKAYKIQRQDKVVLNLAVSSTEALRKKIIDTVK